MLDDWSIFWICLAVTVVSTTCITVFGSNCHKCGFCPFSEDYERVSKLFKEERELNKQLINDERKRYDKIVNILENTQNFV